MNEISLDGRVTMQLRREFVMRHINEDDALLDIGCSDGFISSRSTRYVGIDVDGSLNFNGNSVVADAHHLPFKDGIFDKVVMMEVLEHLKSPYHALMDVHRVLRQRGILLLTTPNSSYVYYFFRNLLSRPTHVEYEKLGHIFEFDFRSLKRLCQSVGFRVLELHGVLIPIPPRGITLRSKSGLRMAGMLGRHFPLVSNGFFMKILKEV